MNKREIILVASGNIEIPPNGYGAVEDIIWNYKIFLEKYGYQVTIVNTKNIFKLIKNTVFVKNKIIHFHYEPYLIISYILNKIFLRKNKIFWTSHNGFISFGGETFLYKIISLIICRFSNSTMISLSKEMEKYFIEKGFKGKKFILQNGVNTRKFHKNEIGKKDIIYLGVIDNRKGQKIFLNYYNPEKKVDFVGPYLDISINLKGNSYLGTWSKNEIYEKLSEYKLLVLLTKSEVGTPLVIKEALASGCSILTSKIGGVNLEQSDFIKIIDIENEVDLKNIDQLVTELLENNEKNRKNIFEYSKKFDWEKIVSDYLFILSKI